MLFISPFDCGKMSYKCYKFTKLARAILINMGFAGDIDNIISFHRGAIGMDKLMKHFLNVNRS